MKRIHWITLAIVVVLIGLIASRVSDRNKEAAMLKEATQPPTPVVAVHPKRGTLHEWVKVTGRLEARHETKVVAQANGRIAQLLADDGAFVKRGQLLAVISPDEAQDQVRQSEAAEGVTAANLLNAEQELARYKPLFAEGGISALQMESYEAKVRSLKAQMAQARASTNLTRTRLGHHRVLSPVSGQVTKRLVEVGDFAAGSPLFTIASTQQVDALFDLPEKELGRISVGQSVRVIPVASLPPVIGTLREIAPTVDPQTHLVQVKVSLPSPLSPGLSVTGEIQVASISGGTLIPVEALMTRNQTLKVMLARADKAAEVPIRLLGRNTEAAAVEGLSPRDVLIVAGQTFVKHGDPVTVQVRNP